MSGAAIQQRCKPSLYNEQAAARAAAATRAAVEAGGAAAAGAGNGCFIGVRLQIMASRVIVAGAGMCRTQIERWTLKSQKVCQTSDELAMIEETLAQTASRCARRSRCTPCLVVHIVIYDGTVAEEVGTAWDDDAAEELLNLPPPPYTPAGGNQPIVVEQDSVALDIGQMNEEESEFNSFTLTLLKELCSVIQLLCGSACSCHQAINGGSKMKK